MVDFSQTNKFTNSSIPRPHSGHSSAFDGKVTGYVFLGIIGLIGLGLLFEVFM